MDTLKNGERYSNECLHYEHIGIYLYTRTRKYTQQKAENDMTNKTIQETITEIAVASIDGIETLEDRNSDSLDFHEVSVWELRAALRNAYNAGKRAAKK